MRTLFHLPLDPFSRKIRVVMAEKQLDMELIVEPIWERREAFFIAKPIRYCSRFKRTRWLYHCHIPSYSGVFRGDNTSSLSNLRHTKSKGRN
jgi:hypothetical protein